MTGGVWLSGWELAADGHREEKAYGIQRKGGSMAEGVECIGEKRILSVSWTICSLRCEMDS